MPLPFNAYAQRLERRFEETVTGLNLGKISLEKDHIKIASKLPKDSALALVELLDQRLAALDTTGTLITKVIPEENVAPSGSGLYLGSDYMGYYDGAAWKTYMDSSGNFYLGGIDGALAWDGTSLTITIGSSNLGDLSVLDTVGNAQIDDLAVTGGKIADTTITGGKIVTGTITATQIAAGTITADEIATGTITATQIAASTITGDKIAATTIEAANIVAGTITATEIVSTAGLNGKRLSSYADGSVTVGSASYTTVTHNLGRKAVADCWCSPNCVSNPSYEQYLFITEHTTTTFNIRNTGGTSQTVYYAYF